MSVGRFLSLRVVRQGFCTATNVEKKKLVRTVLIPRVTFGSFFAVVVKVGSL